MIHVVTPFRVDKNLGKAYNDAFERCPDDDWLCLIDYDVMFLQSNTIALMHDYIFKYPDAGMFVCRANRIHPLAKDQLWFDSPSGEDSIAYWQGIAKYCSDNETGVKEITHEISGFLMLISKKVWNELKFNETGKCLGVDNDFSLRVLAAGKKILRMNNVLVWHSYRLNDIKDKSHLL